MDYSINKYIVNITCIHIILVRRLNRKIQHSYQLTLHIFRSSVSIYIYCIFLLSRKTINELLRVENDNRVGNLLIIETAVLDSRQPSHLPSNMKALPNITPKPLCVIHLVIFLILRRVVWTLYWHVSGCQPHHVDGVTYISAAHTDHEAMIYGFGFGIGVEN